MIVIRDDQTKQTLGFLVKYDLEEDLTQVRKQIQQQLGALVHNDFKFKFFGCSISCLQESNYLLKQCISKTELKGFKYEIVIKNNSEGKASETVQDLRSNSPVSIGQKPDIETDGFLGFKSKSTSQFENKTLKPETGTESNSPLIRRYSVKELEECYPDELFERERKRFWNQKAEEVENDIALRHWGVQALNGVVDVAWTLKKTELLQLHVQKCETVYTEIMKDNSVLSKSMMGNLDQVERAHAALNCKYNDLCKQMGDGKITQADLDQGLDEKFSVLKKTQANLVKSYQAFISKCTRRSGTGEGSCGYKHEIEDLKHEEMNALVEDVCMDGYISE
ncbi:Hypothetical predicted protein [Paramuricea clavata]|uniref:Uncharacterized protein n=1 Tax=Paramuricea clavata TaxID=317549 RepID=A0A6S7INP8_PARCT|nr:Hypothetical predicted protein [Paramuricea clavata]